MFEEKEDIKSVVLRPSLAGVFTGFFSILFGGLILCISVENILSDLNRNASVLGGVLSILMFATGVIRIFGVLVIDDDCITRRLFSFTFKKINLSELTCYTIGRPFGFGTQWNTVELRSKNNKILLNVSNGEFTNGEHKALEWARRGNLPNKTIVDGIL